jgi:hypothetical protein
MKVHELLGKPVAGILRARLVISNSISKTTHNWRQKKVNKKTITPQRKLLGR